MSEETKAPETAVEHNQKFPPRWCPSCGSQPQDHVVKNFDPMFRDGDVYCTKCGAYVRMYDAS